MIQANSKYTNSNYSCEYFKKSSSHQPMNPERSEIYVLNQIGCEIAPDTVEVPNECYPKKKGYTYFDDGRVVDMRGMRTVLDRPAIIATNTGLYKNFVAPTPDYKLGTYKDYRKMSNSNIQYYVDTSVAQPFFNPIYTLTSKVDKMVYVSPMDSLQPVYNKIPVTSTLNAVSKDSATRDQLSFRDDLIEKQQSGYLKTSWTAYMVKP